MCPASYLLSAFDSRTPYRVRSLTYFPPSLVLPLNVRFFLDPVTAAKIQIHSDVPAALFDLMSKKTVPKEFGGESDVVLRRCVPWQDIQRDGGHEGLSLEDAVAKGLLVGHHDATSKEEEERPTEVVDDEKAETRE